MMRYRKLGRHEAEVSVIALGGHEFLGDGRSRAFNEDSKRAVTPGAIFPGFGGEKRKKVLAAAYAHGIDLFDVTVDSEKEALGRNLREMPPPYPVLIQTRPEGMVYSYDPNNRKMADYGLLRAEVQRALKLLQRERIDIYNFAFQQSALDADPEYLEKIAHHLAELKREGLIRFAAADTFSGEATYLRQIHGGCFDSLFINFNVADAGPARNVFGAAQARKMSVITREAFGKGAWFRVGEEAGVHDRALLARTALKWVLAHEPVTAVAIGADTPEQLAVSVQASDEGTLSDEENSVLQHVTRSEGFQTWAKARRVSFCGNE